MDATIHRPVPLAVAAKMLGVHKDTVTRYAKQGSLKYHTTPGGHRRFKIEDLRKAATVIELRGKASSQPTEPRTSTDNRVSIVYARVSSHGQKDDLERQVAFLKSRFPDYVVIKDVGSGLNFKRKGLQRLLERVLRGEIKDIVVAHKDRLCRFAYDLIEWICDRKNTNIVVLGEDDAKRTTHGEFVEDMLSIIHVFSARIHGMRAYGKRCKQTLLKEETDEENPRKRKRRETRSQASEEEGGQTPSKSGV